MDRREVRTDNRVTGEILVISGRLTEGDSANSRKASLKRLRHEVMADTLQLNPEMLYSLSFSSADRYDVVKPHADPLVVTALMSSFKIQRMLVDIGSSEDVLFWDAF